MFAEATTNALTSDTRCESDQPLRNAIGRIVLPAADRHRFVVFSVTPHELDPGGFAPADPHASARGAPLPRACGAPARYAAR
jgi:hypothetical protein